MSNLFSPKRLLLSWGSRWTLISLPGIIRIQNGIVLNTCMYPFIKGVCFVSLKVKITKLFRPIIISLVSIVRLNLSSDLINLRTLTGVYCLMIILFLYRRSCGFVWWRWYWWSEARTKWGRKDIIFWGLIVQTTRGVGGGAGTPL